MKQIRTAKQLTFTYFSIVAFAIIAFHFSMFDSMLEGMESIYAKNRMEKDKATALRELEGTNLTHVRVPPFSDIYVGKENIPPGIVLVSNMDYEEPYELDERSDTNLEMFSMRSRVVLNGQSKDVYLIHYDEVYESSENEMFEKQTTQLFLSLLLLVISLWVVMRISDRLTRPLSQLSQDLEQRRPENISSISVPKGAATREIYHLVERLNNYQKQIQELIERERAFSRYASHELRTPLMVIKGALTLISKSQDKAFYERQRSRIAQACQEMEDYITTLLSLTRDDDLDAIPIRMVDEEELYSIWKAHESWLAGKEVEVKVLVEENVKTQLPVPTFHILIGNLLKNAFACTEEGSVKIIMRANTIDVVDSGCGLSGKPGGESYGLGLMIVRDICTKYHCEFFLHDNHGEGCTAKVTFPEGDKR